MTNWLKMTASDLGRGIGAGEIDPVALCECYLEAIAAHPLRDRIYARLTTERAMSEAEVARARAKAGLRLSPLDGVPISWKDLFDTAGIATEAGSALLKDRVPPHDARVLRNATHAGLVCLGKTHMSELAFSGLGYNPVTETSPCVNDLDAVAGGSSSGAATSVAFDLAAAGIGSDTGGSVRLPAAWNDLVGLKTTAGLLSLDGVVKLIESFDTVGPLTRSVEDAAALMAVMLPGAWPDLRDADLSGRRFAILNTIAMSDLDAAPAAAFEQSVERLSRAGAQIDTIEFPELAIAMDLSGPLYTAEAYGEWGEMIEANPGVLFAGILDRFEAGAKVPASAFYRGWQRLRAIRSAYAAATDGFDAVLLPSVPILPPKIDRLAADHDYFTSINLTSLRNTRIGNLLGLCALTLPTGTPSCGVMMMAKPNSEAALLRLGAAAEKALA
jgi:aspartyl-tRNA(Asn)/glutamyl-tRNA(Gln) amidotransferase subunit A